MGLTIKACTRIIFPCSDQDCLYLLVCCLEVYCKNLRFACQLFQRFCLNDIFDPFLSFHIKFPIFSWYSIKAFQILISKNIFPWNRNCSLWVTVVCLARLNMSNWFFYLGKYVLYYIYKIFANCSFGLIYLKRILMINLLSSATLT